MKDKEMGWGAEFSDFRIPCATELSLTCGGKQVALMQARTPEDPTQTLSQTSDF